MGGHFKTGQKYFCFHKCPCHDMMAGRETVGARAGQYQVLHVNININIAFAVKGQSIPISISILPPILLPNININIIDIECW